MPLKLTAFITAATIPAFAVVSLAQIGPAQILAELSTEERKNGITELSTRERETDIAELSARERETDIAELSERERETDIAELSRDERNGVALG